MTLAHVTVVIDVLNGCIVCQRFSRCMQTHSVLDALEPGLHARQVGKALNQYSDMGAQYLSVRYSEQLENAGV